MRQAELQENMETRAKMPCADVAVLTFSSLSFSLSVLARSDGVSHACSLLRIW